MGTKKYYSEMKIIFIEWMTLLFQMFLVMVMGGLGIAFLGLIAGLTSRMFMYGYRLLPAW